MNILLIATCTFPANQGTQISLRAMWRTLGRQGVKITMLSFGRVEPSDVGTARHLVSPWPKVSRRSGLSMARCWADVFLAIKGLRLLQHGAYDVLCVHSLEGMLMAWFLQRFVPIPIIYQRHTSMAEELPSYVRHTWQRLLLGQLGRLGEWFGIHQAQMVLEFAGQTKLPGISKEQWLQQWRSPTGQRGTLMWGSLLPMVDGQEVWQAMLVVHRKAVRSMRHDGPFVLYAGNSDGYQHLSLLEQAWPWVLAEIPKARLILASFHQPHGARGFARLVQLHRCQGIHLKDVHDLAFWLQTAHVGVAPRIMEKGFAVKALTYLLADRPSVVCQQGSQALLGLPYGLIVTDAQPKAYAQGIVQALQSKRRLGKIRQGTLQWLEQGHQLWLSWLGASPEI